MTGPAATPPSRRSPAGPWSPAVGMILWPAAPGGEAVLALGYPAAADHRADYQRLVLGTRTDITARATTVSVEKTEVDEPWVEVGIRYYLADGTVDTGPPGDRIAVRVPAGLRNRPATINRFRACHFMRVIFLERMPARPLHTLKRIVHLDRVGRLTPESHPNRHTTVRALTVFGRVIKAGTGADIQ